MKLKVSQSIEIRKILGVSSHQKNSDHTFAVHPSLHPKGFPRDSENLAVPTGQPPETRRNPVVTLVGFRKKGKVPGSIGAAGGRFLER